MAQVTARTDDELLKIAGFGPVTLDEVRNKTAEFMPHHPSSFGDSEPQLYQDYSRKQVHHIFSPETPFTPGAGTWGISGIVPVSGSRSDFVFFVSFGRTWAHHAFDEGITEDGILSWQSQPRQTLKASRS